MSAARGKGNGLTLEIEEGITEHANRVALKGVFSAFGDVLACWVPPIDRRLVDNASVRFAAAQSAEAAKAACDAGQVFFQGLPLKVKWRAGGGPRVGNSDIGGTVGGNSPTRRNSMERDRSHDRRRSRSRGRRRGSRSRDRRRRSRSQDKKRGRSFADEGKGEEPFNPLADAPPPQLMPPPDMLHAYRPPLPYGGTIMPGIVPGLPFLQAAAASPPVEEKDPVAAALEAEMEAKRKKEAQAARQAQLKRGPGVAALVQGALKRAQTAVVKKNEADKDDQVENLDDDKVEKVDKEDPAKKAAKEARKEKAKKEEQQKREEAQQAKAAELKKLEKTKAEMEEERRRVEKAEREEKERQEREALEREREKARRQAEEAEKEEEKLKAEAANREARVRAGVEAAKKQQAEREKKESAKLSAAKGAENLYGDMPEPNIDAEDVANEARRKEAMRTQKANLALPPEDRSKVVFLDIDGVLRPARAGGFDISAADLSQTAHPDTTDFFPSAMQALRHIIERTGAIIVLSSEWRRNEALRDAVDEVLEANRLRPCYGMTKADVNIKTTAGADPVRLFAERRAQEVSTWLRDHEDTVKGWVVLDDINLAIVDEDKKPGAKLMGPKLVQTWPLCGLTTGNAKTAVRILNGEMIHKVLVERPKAPGGITGAAGAAGAAQAPPAAGAAPGGRA